MTNELDHATDLKKLFLLDPEIIFLNHGSFGACPKPVFEVYQEWQRKLERQPVEFLGRKVYEYDQQARQILADYLRAERDDLVFVLNATHGVNIVARSLNLMPGDEILTTDHEYGACNYTWEYICHLTGARYIHQPVEVPVESEEQIVDQLWRGVTSKTKVLFISHITSPTALRMPVEIICARAREQGIITLVDGAHAAGQIDLDLSAIGADFYTGNCHKWMLSPKGAAFLHTRKEMQSIIQPLVVSWGYSPTAQETHGSRYVDLLAWTGTRDPASALAVPAAISFMRSYQWDSVRHSCNLLLQEAIQEIHSKFNTTPIAAPGTNFFTQMGTASLPESTNLAYLKETLYEQYKIEIPCVEWNKKKMVRISVQGYNTKQDLDLLIQALDDLL